MKDSASRWYNFATSKRITVTAIISEALMLIAIILLGDAVANENLNLPTPLAQHIPISFGIACVIILQYVILTTELFARYRDDTRGMTLPIAFIPGGTILRSVIMFILIAPVITLKLVVYFLSVLLAFVFQICRIHKFRDPAKILDFITDKTDTLLEPIEYFVNKTYNLLYFHKIHANSSIFTSIFNGSLSLWCINH